jgi:hypothetical protein
VLTVALLAAPAARAQPPATPPLSPPAAAPASPVTSVTAGAGRGLTVRTDDDAFSMTVRARVQMRQTVAVVDDDATSELGVRTARATVSGQLLTPRLRYAVQVAFGASDFEAGSPSPLQDAYLDYALARDLQLRVGQTFVPFDRARTIREFALQLVDRQQVVSELNLDRDVGLMLFSPDLLGLGGRLTYALGVFGGAGRNRVGPEEVGFLCVARLGWRPFGAFDDDVEGDLDRLPAPRLALGVAAAFNHNTRRQRSTTGPVLVLGNVDYRHAAADLVFKYRGLSLLAEALLRQGRPDFRDGMIDMLPVREWSRSGWGYLAQAGLMLGRHLELAARWDQLFARSGTDPTLVTLADQRGREAGGGINLYLNGHALKIQADYAVRSGSGAPAIHLARLQLDATF